MERFRPYEPQETKCGWGELSKKQEQAELMETPETEQGAAPKEIDKHEYKDLGIQNVPLEKIDFSDNYVKGPQDFQHGSSYREMAEGFRTLQSEVRPLVEKGADADYFRALDQSRGTDRSHSTLRVYDTFYGHNAVDLVKVGDRYFVGKGGYHRLFVARDLKLDSIPAHVHEKV